MNANEAAASKMLRTFDEVLLLISQASMQPRQTSFASRMMMRSGTPTF